MLDQINPEQILFLDIETVPMCEDYDCMPEDFRVLWDEKARYLCRDSDTPSSIFQRSGIYAEFGRIICISAGYLRREENNYRLRIKSFCDEKEQDLLTAFASLLNNKFNNPDYLLCAHNGKEFDFPYIARRMLVNNIRLPAILNIAGKKPWEIRHLDTMEMWKFGDYKNYTSLKLLAAIFGIPTPKDDIDGSQVYNVYWKEKNLPRIVEYCQKDVVTIARLFLRYKGQPSIEDDFITFV